MFTRKRARPTIRESDLRDLTAHVLTEDEDLLAILPEFEVTPNIDVADDVIGLGSIVSFIDTGSGVTKTVQLVAPDETDAASLKISALSPLGRVLLGAMPGDHIEWQLSGDSSRTLQIIAVIQPPIR